MRYDLDAEHLAVGFWPGDADADARFFGYLVPEPPGCAAYQLGHSGATWATEMGEWVLPYESVRSAADRNSVLFDFMDRIYRAAQDLGGWDAARFNYSPPPRISPAHSSNDASTKP